jgi:aryl-alcohol dehydrogenase-like predicted oxidoreductase
MEFRFLGKTGLKVSALCLGAMTFGRETSEAESYQMLDRFAEAGGNFIDTANVYSRGISEEIVGKWLKGKNRSDWVIATKVRWPMGDGPNEVGLSRKHILDAVDASLRRLGTEYIDLYQTHGWDSAAPLEETLSTLNALVQAGKVRYLGASNVSGWQLQKAVDLSRMHGWEPYVCLQPLYNLLDRELEWELVPVCLNEGIGIIPWSPLRGGWLSGKYQRGMQAPPPNTRVEEAGKYNWGEAWEKYNNERTWKVIDALMEVSRRTGKEPAQVALRWLLQKPGVTAPIIGARTLRHLEINLGATGWTLGAEEMALLDGVSEKELPYPYGIANSRRE